MEAPTPSTDPSVLIATRCRHNRRRWWAPAGVTLAAVAVLGIIYGAALWRGQSLLDREVELIAARGEPVWYADVKLRPDDPAAARGRSIAAAADRIGALPEEPFEAALAAPASPAIQAQVQPLIEAHRATIDDILRQLRQGECRFEHDFESGAPYDTSTHMVRDIKMAARILNAEFRLLVARGDRDKAVQTLLDEFDLEKAAQHEPFSVSLLSYTFDARRALSDLQAGLGMQLLGDAELHHVDARLDEMESSFRMGPSLCCERAALLTTMENLGRSGVRNPLLDNDSEMVAAIVGHWWGSWIYRPRRLHQEVIVLQAMSRMAELIDLPGPQAAEQFAEVADRLHERAPMCQAYSVSELRDAAMNHRQRLISARLAIDVYRFRDSHGRLPQTLSELSDSPFASAIGLITGRPLVYTKAGNGFVIYDGSPNQGRFEVRFAP